MPCERCGGFMVFDAFCDPPEQEPPLGAGPIRCLNCGNLEDTIIRANRANSHVQKYPSSMVQTQRSCT